MALRGAELLRRLGCITFFAALPLSREAQVWQATPATADEDIIMQAPLSFKGSRPVRRNRGALVYHICK